MLWLGCFGLVQVTLGRDNIRQIQIELCSKPTTIVREVCELICVHVCSVEGKLRSSG